MYSASGGDRNISCNIVKAEVDQSIWSQIFVFPFLFQNQDHANKRTQQKPWIDLDGYIKEITEINFWRFASKPRYSPKLKHTKINLAKTKF